MLYLQIKNLLYQQVSQIIKKQVAILATSKLMTGKNIKKEFKQIYCIYYSMTFKDQTETLLNFGSKVTIISQAFTH